MVPGCPDSLIESHIRSAVIELCEISGAYQAELDPVTTIAGLFEYDLEPPAGTVVHKIMWALHDGVDLEPISTSLLEQRQPNWRSADNQGTPRYYVKQTQSTFWLVPTPNVTQTGSVVLRAQLKPTHVSTAADDDLMNEYRDTIVNGALFRLLRIPSKDWTDLQGAQMYGTLFAAGVETASRRARHADEGVARKVRYGGVYSNRATRIGRYGSGG